MSLVGTLNLLRLLTSYGYPVSLSVKPNDYSLYAGFIHLGAGLACGFTGLAAGYAIGFVGDSVSTRYMSPAIQAERLRSVYGHTCSSRRCS